MVFIPITVKDRKDLTLNCLDAIYKQTYKDFQVVVVDDGSADGTAEAILKRYPNTVVLRGDGNLWWTGAMLMAMDYIFKKSKSSDYVLTQNDDTYFDKNYISELVRISEEYDAIIGTTAKDFRTKETIYNAHNEFGYGFHPVTVESKSPVIETATISTRGTMIPMRVFKKVGNFSKLFPHYGADYDFFLRAKREGFKLLISTKVFTYITQRGEGLARRIKNKQANTLRDFYQLVFSRRSTNNIHSTLLIIILYARGFRKVLGTLRTLAFYVKFFVINVVWNNIKIRVVK